MKLNNKGFAVSTFMYMVLLLAIILILATLAISSSRRVILDRQKTTALDNIGNRATSICKHYGNPYSLDPGTKYKCEVSPGTKYFFYILSTEGEGDNQKVNLIMDRNICEDGTVNYKIENSYCRYIWEPGENGNGPATAMTILGNGTRNWNNVPNINLDYYDITDNTSSGYTGSTDNGYTGITILNGVGYITKKDGTTQTPITLTDNMPLKARLPKLKEITDAGCHIYSSDEDYGTCPAWLMGNMTYYNVSSYAGSEYKDKYSMNNNSESYQNQIYGYWLLSSYPSSSNYARIIDYNGTVDRDAINGNDYSGFRPVITLSKNMLK